MSVSELAKVIDERIQHFTKFHYGSFRAVVSSLTSGRVKIQRLEATSADGEEYARIAGLALLPGDEVVCIVLAGKPVIIGKLQRSSPSNLPFDVPVVASNINTPVHQVYHASAALTGSTTNTATYVTGGTSVINLPTGTWTLYILAFIDCQHSTGGNVNAAIRINGGGEVGAVTLPCPSASWSTLKVAEARAALTGSVTVDIRYKGSTAGTTSGRNPAMIIEAKRAS